MCKSLNISDNDLHSCIFDVAITNDTTFTEQENFKRGKSWLQCFCTVSYLLDASFCDVCLSKGWNYTMKVEIYEKLKSV